MKAVKRLTIAGGQYESNGALKTRWVDIGTLFKKDNGEFTILLNSGINLAAYAAIQNNGSPDIWVNLFDINREQKAKPASSAAPAPEVREEDVPF